MVGQYFEELCPWLGYRWRVNPPGIRLFLVSVDNCDGVDELWSVTLTLFPLIMG